MKNYQTINQVAIDSLRTDTRGQLDRKLDNARKKDANWLVEAIEAEQERRLSDENLNPPTIRSHLITKAKAGKICTYGDMADMLGVEWMNIRFKLPRLLGEVLDLMHDEDLPLLTALVADANSKNCGEGFFKKAKQLGHEFENDLVFQKEERRRVFDHWQNK